MKNVSNRLSALIESLPSQCCQRPLAGSCCVTNRYHQAPLFVACCQWSHVVTPITIDDFDVLLETNYHNQVAIPLVFDGSSRFK